MAVCIEVRVRSNLIAALSLDNVSDPLTLASPTWFSGIEAKVWLARSHPLPPVWMVLGVGGPQDHPAKPQSYPLLLSVHLKSTLRLAVLLLF